MCGEDGSCESGPREVPTCKPGGRAEEEEGQFQGVRERAARHTEVDELRKQRLNIRRLQAAARRLSARRVHAREHEHKLGEVAARRAAVRNVHERLVL